MLMDGVVLGDGAAVQNSVLCRGAAVQAGASLKDCQVGCGRSCEREVKRKGRRGPASRTARWGTRATRGTSVQCVREAGLRWYLHTKSKWFGTAKALGGEGALGWGGAAGGPASTLRDCQV